MEGEGRGSCGIGFALTVAAAVLAAVAGSCRVLPGRAGSRGAAPEGRVPSEALARIEDLLAARRAEEALARARELRAARPGAFRAHALVQDALESLGRGDEARRESRRRFERSGDPHDAVLLARLLDDPGDQLALLDRALRDAPWDPWVHFARGAILRRQGRILEAREHLELAAASEEAPPAAWRELAEAREELGEVDGAATAWREFLRSGEDRPRDRERYGALLLLHLDDPAGAARQFRAALAMRPGDLTARKGLAASFLALGQEAEARERLAAILRGFPHDADVLWNLAVAGLNGHGDPSAVREALERYVDAGGERSWLARRILESLSPRDAELPPGEERETTGGGEGRDRR